MLVKSENTVSSDSSLGLGAGGGETTLHLTAVTGSTAALISDLSTVSDRGHSGTQGLRAPGGLQLLTTG